MDYMAYNVTEGHIVHNMGGGERMEREQTTIATSIRLPEKRCAYIKEKALEIGLSQNAFMAMLIDLGIKLYESNTSIIRQLKPE